MTPADLQRLNGLYACWVRLTSKPKKERSAADGAKIWLLRQELEDAGMVLK